GTSTRPGILVSVSRNRCRIAKYPGILTSRCLSSFPYHSPRLTRHSFIQRESFLRKKKETPTIRSGCAEHKVGAAGTVGLGVYGSVKPAGLTLDQARGVVEGYLSAYIKNPKVNVDVYAYNSKFYYIVTDGAGFGQQVYRLPFTGNETVLD